MSVTDMPDPDALLASGFAMRVTAWARKLAQARGAALDRDSLQRLYRAAWHASHATSRGHVCALLADIAGNQTSDELATALEDIDALPALALPEAQAPQADMPAGLDAWRALLRDSGVVGTPADAGAHPLVLDAADRLYLHKYFAFEKSLAGRLQQADWQPAPPSAASRALLDQLFNRGQDADSGQADWQKIAAALALLRPLAIISGGPGTGKTTTVANILACLLQDNPGCRIALAAPTGKAAARMLAALNARAAAIPPALVERFPKESFTVHRLLGVTPSPGVFRHDAQRPIPYDVLVVDEASMLDLALAARLFDAVPRNARIILLGDKDQLAAVEAGAVFSELSANPALSEEVIGAIAGATGIAQQLVQPAADARASGIRDAVVWLSRNYRFAQDSAIGQLAALIVVGQQAQTVEWLQQQEQRHGAQVAQLHGQPAGVRWLAGEGDALPAAALDMAVDAFLPYADIVQQQEQSPVTVLEAFEKFRVLCATRSGERGVSGVNAAVTARLRDRLPGCAAPVGWFVGRPVIVLRNDYGLRLFNGDIGIALRAGDGQLMVMFPDRELGFRAIGISRLPEHETAWAMTVHRSQGSEFDRVMAILPGRDTRVVTRELLYTAVTRAREGLVVVASEGALATAVGTRTVRASGLSDRLRGQ
ncbi:MAG: recD [Paucimonas sp.]|nr:recD [Paucimonas sp.]